MAHVTLESDSLCVHPGCAGPAPTPANGTEVLLCAGHHLTEASPQAYTAFQAHHAHFMDAKGEAQEAGVSDSGSSRARILTQNTHRSSCCQL